MTRTKSAAWISRKPARAWCEPAALVRAGVGREMAAAAARSLLKQMLQAGTHAVMCSMHGGHRACRRRHARARQR